MKHIKRSEAHHYPAVQHAVVKHFPARLARAQKPRDGAHHRNSDCRKRNAERDRERYQHSKISVGFITVVLAQHLCNERRAARAYHKAHAAQNHSERHYEINRSKRRFADEIRDKKTVYYAVNGSYNHHKHRRQNEFEQFAEIKAIRNFNCHNPFSSIKKGARLFYNNRAHPTSSPTADGLRRPTAAAGPPMTFILSLHNVLY